MAQPDMKPADPAQPKPPAPLTPAPNGPAGSKPNPFRSEGLGSPPGLTPARPELPKLEPALPPPVPTTPATQPTVGGNGVHVPTPSPAQPLGPGAAANPTTPGAQPPSMDTIRQAVPGLDRLSQTFTNVGNQLQTAVGQSFAGSTTVPPLVAGGMTKNLPDAIRGPAEGLLGMAQRGFQNNPEGFANVVGGIGRPLIEPLLSTPVGMPLMAGMYGALTGGESGASAYRYFEPLLNKLNGS